MSPRRHSIDILAFSPLKSFILWRGFPYVFQGILLAAFLIIAWFGWNLFPPEGIPDKLYAKSNIVNLLIWGLWWPAMIWVAVLFGRAWCMVCPLELVANAAERLAMRLGTNRRTLGRWLRSGALIVGLYLVLLLLVPGIHLHRIPAYTSIFMLGLIVLAVAVGFLYKDRAFCRAFCPVGMLLNAYGRGGMLAVRSGTASACSSCTGKECVAAHNRYEPDGRSCPSLLNPARLQDNADCLVCGQCIKSCEPENMQVLLRAPFSKEDAREPVASVPLTAFVMLASGFVISELCSESPLAKKLFLAMPEYIATSLNLAHAGGWIEGAWTLVAVPLLLWSVLGTAMMTAGRGYRLIGTWRALALPVAVIVSAGHMSKALAKLTSWIGYLPGTLADPRGVETALAIAAKAQPAPASLLDITSAGSIALVMILGSVFLAAREAKLANGMTYRHKIAPLLALALLFALIVLNWG